jgi:putative hydrolase of the HAD superfamily
MSPQKSLIFDLFGVVCAEVAPFWLPRHFSQRKASALKDDLVARADLGQISQSEMLCELGGLTGLTPEHVEKEWLRLAEVNNDVVSLIEELKPRFKIGLLTNAPSPFARAVLSQHDLTSLFDSIVVSSEIGAVKPDPRSYDAALKKLCAEPATTVLIDDNPRNVEGAKHAGIHALLFKSLMELEKDLRTLGVGCEASDRRLRRRASRREVRLNL